jgi:chemotaxis protein CheZ
MTDDKLNTKGTGNAEAVGKPHMADDDAEACKLQNVKEFLSKKQESTDPGAPDNKTIEELITFMKAMADNDYTAADASVERLVKSSEGELYKEVGKVTRRLHDSLRNFKESIDPRITSLICNEVPSAIDQLQHCVRKAEEAANTTMEIAEKHQRSIRELSANIRKLQSSEDIVKCVDNFRSQYESDLTEIITAQSFQDLTGQTIHKVILLVADIEKELVGMVTAFGLKLEAANEKEINEKINQSDVDELLKEFGF